MLSSFFLSTPHTFLQVLIVLAKEFGHEVDASQQVKVYLWLAWLS